MKKLPPPNGSTPTKKSNGSELAEVDYFKRFDDLVWIYDSQVKDYAELRHPSSSRVVRRLMEQLSPSSLEEWGTDYARGPFSAAACAQVPVLRFSTTVLDWRGRPRAYRRALHAFPGVGAQSPNIKN